MATLKWYNTGTAQWEAIGIPTGTILDGITGLIQTVTATTYNLMIRAPFAGAITAVGGIVSVGTCDIQVGINGTPLGVVTGISSVYAEQVHAASNTFVVNDIITLVISNLATDPADLDFVIKMTRTI